jgi:hypothetical protein
MYFHYNNEEIAEWKDKAHKLGMNQENIKYLRVETDSNTFVNLKVYFLLDDKEHFFSMNNVDSLDGKWVTYYIGPPTNEREVLEQRKNEAKMPYVPWGLYSTGSNWGWRSNEKKKFTNVWTTIKNNTDYDFHQIKFRITVIDKTDFNSVLFSKVITKRETLSAGDVIRFEIIELRNFYTTFDISNDNNFDITVEIEDAKPKPGFEDLDY